MSESVTPQKPPTERRAEVEAMLKAVEREVAFIARRRRGTGYWYWLLVIRAET